MKARTREPRRADRDRHSGRLRDRRVVTIVVLAVVAVALYAVIVPVNTVRYDTPLPVTMLLAAAVVAAPLIAIRRPTIAIVMFTAAAVLIPLTVPRESALGLPWPWSPQMLIAFAVVVASVTFHHGWRLGLIQLALGSAAGLTAAIVQPGIPSGSSLIVTTSVVGGVYIVAVLLGSRLRLGAELSREREHTAQEQARRELVEERTRIARELHDVVAHSLSLIQVQASTARYRVPGLADDAAAEFDDIAASARGALAEMRRVLGVLRTEDHTAELAPQRGIDDIPSLVETTRRAGADVALATAVEGDISPATQIAAYRIAQEALSNAVRHAPGTPITVSVTAASDDVRLVVRNTRDPESDQSEAAQGGHGLRGMGERAALLGGSITAGSDADGGWTVAASLPRHPITTHFEGTR